MFDKTRDKVVEKNLCLYNYHKGKIREFTAIAIRQGTYSMDNVGHGNKISKPTETGGIMLSNPPEQIKNSYDWVEAIDDAYNECAYLDSYMESVNGLSYIMKKRFLEPILKFGKKDFEKLCADCRLSKRTMYGKIHRIVEITSYYAAKRELI